MTSATAVSSRSNTDCLIQPVQFSRPLNTPIFRLLHTRMPISICLSLNQPVPPRPIAGYSSKSSISCKLLALYVDCIKEDDFSGCSVVREVEIYGTAEVVAAAKASTIDSTEELEERRLEEVQERKKQNGS